MALVALNRGVSTQEREAVLVIAHLLHRDIPTLHGMALRAVGAHLATMDVRVAIGAILTHVGEYGFYVALGALHFFVQAAEGIFRFVVIEFRNCADGAPACRGMTVFARNVQRTVRIPLAFLLGVARSGCRW